MAYIPVSAINGQSAERLIQAATRLCESNSMRLALMFDIVLNDSEWTLRLFPRPKRVCYSLNLPQKAP